MTLNKAERIKLDIRCQYGGLTGKRYGDVVLRFHVDEQDMASALRVVLGKDRPMVALIISGETKHVIGEVVFGGVNVKASGDTVVSLDTSLEFLRMPIQNLKTLLDEYFTLRILIG